MARRKHYHVLMGMEGGYMPSSNSFAENRKEAVGSALEDIARHRDQGRGYTAIGSAARGLWVLHTPHEGPHTLNEYIEIVECDEPECRATYEKYGSLD